MKSQQSNNLVSKLHQIKEQMDILGQPESRATLLSTIDDLVAALSRLRGELTTGLLQERAAGIRTPLEQVIGFLESAKSDETLQKALSLSGIAPTSKPKRLAVEIPSNLSNDEIRVLLQKDLSKAELKTIAMQRAISIAELNIAEIKRAILRNLERQEGYGRLASR